jgi:hypothetical protein
VYLGLFSRFVSLRVFCLVMINVVGLQYTISSGALPPGITLLATSGLFTGIPTTPGSYTFNYKVTDFLATNAQRTCTIVINPPLVYNCPTPTSVNAYASSYTDPLSASGGTGTGYTFALQAGILPPGITNNGTALVGSPTVAGTFSFVIGGVDSSGSAANATCSITVVGPSADCPSPNSAAGYFYNYTLVGVGGTGTGYTFTIGGGGLPAGLSISNGVITGFPVASPGTYYHSITVRDSSSTTRVNPSCYIIVGSPIVVTCPSNIGEVGYPYGSYTPTQTNALGTPTWSVYPPTALSSVGFSISPSQFSCGVTGSPVSPFNVSFALQVTGTLVLMGLFVVFLNHSFDT